MFLAMAIPPIVYGVLSLTIPESPRYLIANLRIPEARKVLTDDARYGRHRGARSSGSRARWSRDHKPSFRT